MYAIRAIGIIGRYSPLPLPEGGNDVQSEDNKINTVSLTKAELVRKLIRLLSSVSESKLIERLSLTLGYLCVGEPAIAYKVRACKSYRVCHADY